MKDIPMFTTDYGVASLVLAEIPYKQVAFVHVRDVQPGKMKEHLAECVSFCRAAGAERVLASGHSELESYPIHSVVEEMALAYEPREPQAMLWPVTEKTVAQWRKLYNEAMAEVDNHSTLTAFHEKAILASGGAYFVHQNEELLGLGWVEGNQLLAVVSLQPGMGETVARTLFTAMNTDRITLEVVTSNNRAVALYRRMGFVKTQELRRWYKIF